MCVLGGKGPLILQILEGKQSSLACILQTFLEKEGVSSLRA